MSNTPTMVQWFKMGESVGATHILIINDLVDHELYPVYIKADEQFWVRYDCFHGKNKQVVDEVFDLKIDRDTQLNSTTKVMNTPPR